MADTCIWTGASGKKYTYEIFEIGTSWNDVAGNYIFAHRTQPNAPHQWEAVYIGETASFKDRIPNHNELPCIRRNGGTHVHAHTNTDNRARLDEEADLLKGLTTPCNG